MDDPGYHAHRRAAKEDAYYAHLRPPPSDKPHDGVEYVLPMNEAWVKDLVPEDESRKVDGTDGYEETRYRPASSVKPEYLGTTAPGHADQGTTSGPVPPTSAVGSEQKPNGTATAQPNGAGLLDVSRPDGLARHHSVSERMMPHLQLMCGPLLSYYTIKNNVWYGAAMVVTADSGSVYEPFPHLSLDFAPSKFAKARQLDQPALSGQLPQSRRVHGHQLYNYHGPQGTFTFWRFMLEIPQQSYEQAVTYRLNGGAATEFLVPRAGENLRWMAHSCNGFSAGVKMEDFKTDKFESGYDPLWCDVLQKHDEFGYHTMVGGGDQIYCDSITREPELQPWITAVKPTDKLHSPLTNEIKSAVDRYYFSHYCRLFRLGAFGKANARIPMVNMLDDHDLIDGFGSYDEQTMRSPIFQYIGGRGYFWFLLFQLFTTDDLDGTNPVPGTHPLKSMIIGGEGPYIPSVNHSLSVSLGPKVHMYLLDCRAERMLKQICSQVTYQRMFDELEKLPSEVEQVVIQLGVPIAYPRMSIVEHFLESKFNPLNLIGRLSPSGLGGFSNKFDKDAELLDDLNDHWCAKFHKRERNWFILETQKLALAKRLRVTFLSGDVHCAAVGLLHTYYGHHGEPKDLEPSKDHRYMMNVITSAIVNTPPPAGAQMMVSMFARNKHRTLHRDHTDEIMMPLFKHDPDDSSRKSPYIMGRRNYTSITFDEQSGNLNFDICVEKVQGTGETKGYGVISPPPRW